ncbi:MAG: flagellar biosynthetic protein FliO [Candidatus Eremiobacteraeota bacterium]|nr:flagellar biosynthetic protein FliO [Candidatus Eremiobacteraeota bacterium]MBV9264438.1 flagellar biosynthetic protein FliO [Candidatus Eremiobacteraeota bacterium]
MAAILLLLYVLARKLRKVRFLNGGPSRLLQVVESRMLSQHAAIHVVRAGHRYFLVGTTSGAVVTLGEVDPGDVPNHGGICRHPSTGSG